MKGLIILANGFEDVEAIAVIDILKRANIKLTIAALNNKNEVFSSSNLRLVVDNNLKEIEYKEYDFLILPGGKAVFNELEKSRLVEEVIKHFADNKKLICAICAAPLLVGRLGYLKDINFSIFKGCENQVIGGKLSDAPVTIDKNFITAKSMYYSCDFALEIINYVKGNEKAIEIAKQIKSL